MPCDAATLVPQLDRRRRQLDLHDGARDRRVDVRDGLGGLDLTEAVARLHCGPDPGNLHEHDIAEYGTRTASFRDGVVVKDHPVAQRRLAQDELLALPAESLT